MLQLYHKAEKGKAGHGNRCTHDYPQLSPYADEISETASRVFASGNHRWSIRDARLSQMCFNTDWEYYGAVGRFLKVIGQP